MMRRTLTAFALAAAGGVAIGLCFGPGLAPAEAFVQHRCDASCRHDAAGSVPLDADCSDGFCRHRRSARTGAILPRADEECANYCARFSACSIDKNLAGASGAELERYTAEKAQDGHAFDGWLAPELTFDTTTGRRVALSGYRGRPVALVTLAVHCRHSYDTLPIIETLKQKYEPHVAVLPVYVNVSPADVVASTQLLDLGFPLLVSPGRTLAERLDSRMVPTTFLIDDEGRITRKLVGFKSGAELDAAVAALARS